MSIISGGPGPEKQQMMIREKTRKHLDDYAKRGLRTLCVAKRVRLLGHPLASCSPVFNHHLMEASVCETLIQASEKVPGPVAFFSYSFFIPYILVGQSVSSKHFARKVFSRSEYFHLETAVWLGIKIPGSYCLALSTLYMSFLCLVALNVPLKE